MTKPRKNIPKWIKDANQPELVDLLLKLIKGKSNEEKWKWLYTFSCLLNIEKARLVNIGLDWEKV